MRILFINGSLHGQQGNTFPLVEKLCKFFHNDYTVESITYGFYKGKLSFIMITTVGYTNSRGILNLLVTQYGKGYQPNQYIEEYWWFGKTVSLNYKENSINNNGKIIMTTNIFDEEKAADKKAATEKAKNDL